MSVTKNQHYIPRSYLKEFGKGTKNNFFLWKIVLKKPNFKPEKDYIGKTLCSLKNFYTINTQESFLASRLGDNPNIIEDKGFAYENNLPKLLKKLTPKEANFQRLSWEDTFNLIDALISIKFRNPLVRNIYISGRREIEDKIPIAHRQIDEIIARIPPKDTILLDFANKLKKKIDFDLANPEELLKTLHTVVLQLDPDENFKNKVNNLGDHFLKAKWEIIRTNSNHEFITSDNPGIFLNRQHQVWSLVFEDFESHGIDRFFFPLSPLHGLLIHLLEKDSRLTKGEDKVIPVTYSPNKVEEFNISHCTIANEILMASSEKALIETAKMGKRFWMDLRANVQSNK